MGNAANSKILQCYGWRRGRAGKALICAMLLLGVTPTVWLARRHSRGAASTVSARVPRQGTTTTATGWGSTQVAPPAISSARPASLMPRQAVATAPHSPAALGSSHNEGAAAQPVTYARIPLRFEPNLGQRNDHIRFIGHAGAYEVELQGRQVTFTIPRRAERDRGVHLEFLGAKQEPRIAALGELPGKANYLGSAHPNSWITGIPTYAGVEYEEVYPGIDLLFHGNDGRLEYDFTVAPGADPDNIAWRFDPTTKVRLSGSGDLLLEAEGAELQLLRPVIYQPWGAERRYVSGSYHVDETAAGTVVQFVLGSYDHTRTLIIDPVLSYSTRAVGLSDVLAMTTDSAGNVYLAYSYYGIEIVKLGPDGRTVAYSTNLGSSYYAEIAAIAVDSFGQLYLTGQAGPGFPTTANGYDLVSGSGYHAFLAVLNASGSALTYSTYLQGSSTDYGNSVALDSSGKVLVGGYTYSVDFPNTSSALLTGAETAFVCKIDPTLVGPASLLYSTVVPGSWQSDTVGVAADGSGSAYAVIQGNTLNSTPGAFAYDSMNPGYGVFVLKLDSSGATQFLSYLGEGQSYGIAADAAGNTYVTGEVWSADFPATTGAYGTTYPDSFLAKLNPAGTALVYSTYLSGPSGGATPISVAVPAGCSAACNAYVAGYTSATDFPTSNAIQNSQYMPGNSTNVFLVELSGDGASAVFSTYLGGNSYDNYYSNYHLPEVALDAAANIYVAGNTGSPDFPVTIPGSDSAFVAKISPNPGGIVIPDQYSVNFGTQTLNVTSATQTVVLRNLGTTTVTLSPLQASVGFAARDNCGGSIAGGSTCQAQVTFTPTNVGTISGTLTLTHTGSNTPTVVNLSGYGADQALLSLAPATLQFGSQTVNTSSTAQTVTLSNLGTQAAYIYSIYVSSGHPEFVQTNNCPEYLLPGASCSVSVTFAPYTVGYFSPSLWFSTSSNFKGPSYVNLYGTGVGVGTSGLTASTTALAFPDQAVGTTSTYQSYAVTNVGTIAVSFAQPTITGDFAIYSNGCTSTLSPGSSCNVYVTFAPTATGSLTGTITLNTSTGAGPAVSLSGNGLTATEGLVFSPSAVVFADQVVGTESNSQYITVTNVGTAAVTIDRIYDSGMDFRVSSTGCVTVLQPHNSCSTWVTFTPTTAGALTGTITLLDNAPGSPQTISLSGNGLSPTQSLVATPAAVGFDDTVVGATSSQSVTLYNPGNTNISVSSIVSGLADFVITSNNCSTVTADWQCSFNVQFQPTQAGLRTSTITITDTAPGSPHTVSVSGTGLAASNTVQATPLSVGFDDTVVGATSGTQAITFYNPGNTSVNVSSVQVSGDFSIYYNWCVPRINPQSSCTVNVQFAPTQAGARTGTLSMQDDAPGSPHTVALSGTGVNPFTEIVATPGSLGFQDQVVGTTSSYSGNAFYNPGNTAVSVSSVVTSGDFAIYSNGCSTQVAANGNCTVYVTFTPTGAGARTGTLTMTDSAAGSPHGVSLYGNGVAATTTMALTPASIDFGSVQQATSAPSQTLYLTNTGSQTITVSSVTASTDFSVSGCTSISPRSWCTLTVGFTPSSTSPETGTITINDNASGNPHSVSLTGTGTSTAPAISIAPNGLAFAGTLVGTTSNNLGVNFKNQSGSSVTVSGVAASGDFAVVNNYCGTVSTGGSCSVYVSFTPTASGNRTATLTFTHNGPGSPTTINLSGLGQDVVNDVQLSATALAFNDQVVGSSSSAQTVHLWNMGTAPVTMGTTSITGDFTVTYNGCTGTVNANSSCSFNVNFQPTVAGARTGAVTVNASDPNSPHVVTLSGNGANPSKTVALSATALQFRDQPINTASGAQQLTLYNTGNVAVTVSSVVASGAQTAADFQLSYNYCTTLSAGGSCVMAVTFNPSAQGALTGSVTISDDAAGSPQTVALSGNGVAATKSLALTATALAFQDQPVGTTSGTQLFYINNTGTVPVALLSYGLSTSDFAVSYTSCPFASTLNAGGNCYLAVAFQPSASLAPGTRTGTLTINNDSPSAAIPVALTGNAVAVVHAARVSAASIAYADTPVGTTSPGQWVYLYNTGNVPLNVSSTVVTGDYSLSNNSCAGYTVDSSCNVYVTFTPTTAGPRSGTLTFTDDASSSPQVVSLSGNGVTPSASVSVSPGSLQFVPQVTGTSSSYQNVTVTNTGNLPVSFSNVSLSDSTNFGLYLYSCVGTTLSGYGSACNFPIQFTPATTGALQATLSFNDSGGNAHSVTLGGSGISSSQAIQLSQASVTFGNQAIGTTSPVVSVYYVNQGNTAVTISSTVVAGDFQVSGCGSGSTAYVSASSSCVMSVQFKPTASGTRSGSITITDNASGSPRTIALSGTGVNPYPVATLSSSALAFATQNVGTSSTYQSLTLSNTGTAGLNISAIGPATVADFSVSSTTCPVGTGPLAAGSNCTIYVVFTPSTASSISGSLPITDDAAGSPQTVALSGTGANASPIATLSPNPVSFGNQAVNTSSAAQTITLKNNGNAVMMINAIAIAGISPASSGTDFAQTNNCPIYPAAALSAGSTCTINVSFTPTVTGAESATLTVTDNASGSPHTVGLSGTGLSGPVISISPAGLIFNTQQVGTSSSGQTVTVSNSGSAMSISSIVIGSGTDFAQTNNCPIAPTATLGTGSSCTITATFTPTTNGTRTDTITITDNASGSPHTIALSGTGVGVPAVTLSPTSLSFGNQNVGTSSAAQTVTLTNSGQGPLSISSISAGSNYTQTNNCGNNVDAGFSCTINVAFSPQAIGALAGTLTVSDNATGSPHTVALSGTGLGAQPSVSPTTLDFGSVAVGSSSTAQAVTLTNTGNVSMTITEINTYNSQFTQTNNCGSSLAASASCTINVMFTPTTASTQSTDMYVYTNGPSAYVTLNGTGYGPVASVSPTTLSFGSVDVGSVSPASTVTVSSTGSVAVTISSISATGDFTQTNTCPPTLATSSNCTISVTFAPAAAGTRTGTLYVYDNTSSSPHQVSLSGTGLGAAVTLSPNGLNFGNVALGSTSGSQNIIVTNSGTNALLITGIAATGDFAQTNNCPSSLAAGATCSISVTFTPTLVGTRSGSVTISSNLPSQSASLTGVGTGPQAQLSPASLSFGSVPVSASSSAQTITLTNSGNATLTITSIASSSTDFVQANNCPGSLAAGSFCTISVTFTPTVQAAETATITVTDDAAGSPHTASLSGTGTGPQADIAVAGPLGTCTAAPITCNLGNVAPGGNVSFPITVTNNGLSPATGVVLTATAPTNTMVDSVSATAGTCSGSGPITCTIGNLAVGGSVTVAINATATGAGTLSTTASATANETDPNTANNSATLLATVPAADLRMTAASAPTTAGGVPAYTMTVTNYGPSAASGVQMSCSLDRFTYAGASATCSYSNGTLACSLGTLAGPAIAGAAGGSAAVTVQVQPPSTGWATIVCTASATSPPDPNPTNNVAQISSQPEAVDQAPVANAGGNRVAPGTSVLGTSVLLDGSLSTDPDGNSLTYRWTGPFPEGNGTVTGVKPTVTLPFGTSTVTLVVNDGKMDSLPATANISVSDFTIGLTTANISVARGQSATVTVTVAPKGGAFAQAVTLACANLPANMTCQFSPATVQPGSNGASATLTISTSLLARTVPPVRPRGRPWPPLWGMGSGMIGIAGILFVGAGRRRLWGWSLLLGVVVLAAAFYVGCGGGGGGPAQQTTSSSSTAVVTITGTSSGLQHSTTATVVQR